MTGTKNAQLSKSGNVPLTKMIQDSGRKYIRSIDIIHLAERKYTNNGSGITYNDLRIAGFVHRKSEAQRKLKYLRSKKKLFVLQNRKPQRYYPISIKSKIIENIKKKKNVPFGGTGMAYSDMINPLEEQKIKSLKEILDSRSYTFAHA